ncbi:MAG: hypothetical protein ABUS56_06295 [Acidobacteriota bacterium]
MTRPAAARLEPPAPVPTKRPPLWLIASTGVLAVLILVLAVAETNLRAHYLIDDGEFISIVGLVFMVGAGIVLFRRRQLVVSMPLALPWLLYPVITQGDQIIDNLSINPMRAICHVLLAAIFATPVAVIVVAAQFVLSPRDGAPRTAGGWTAVVPGLRQIAEGRHAREGAAFLAASLLTLEMWLADQYLGTLMIVTLIVMVLAVLVWGSSPEPPPHAQGERRLRNERAALGVLLVGIAISAGLFYGFKNRQGAYQGSPSFYMDPSQQGSNYTLDRVVVPSGPPTAPRSPELVKGALAAYGQTLERLLAGYHILDRNYTYDFHNELFVRQTPLIPHYRAVGLARIAEARQLRDVADQRATEARATLTDDDPLAALPDDLRGYVAFNFNRAPILERLSGQFEKTPAGLQHAAHLYEGEGKFLGRRLEDIVGKYRAAMDSPALKPVTADFETSSHALFEAYAHHVVGF